MKERLITLGGALLAAFILYTLMFPQAAEIKKVVSMPTTEDRGEYGLAGLKNWLDKSGVATLALQHRYHELHQNPELNGTGNLLIISVPMRLNMRELESNQLSTWLAQGNHVLVLAAMSDWPEWALRQHGHSVKQVFDLLGVKLVPAETDTEDKPENSKTGPEDSPDNEEAGNKEKPTLSGIAEDIKQRLNPEKTPQTLVSKGQHPVSRFIEEVKVYKLQSEGQNWELSGTSSKRSGLVILKNKQTDAAALWQVRIGHGSAWISSHADMFGNKLLGQADNARLFSNIINASVATGGFVIFDDTHQGLTAMYDPDAFFKDSRLHNTIWFIVFLWLVYVLGYSNRFHPFIRKVRQQRLVDHVKAFGGLFARRLHSSAVARRIFLFFFNEIRHIYALPQNGQAVWSQLEDNPAIKSDELIRLKQLYERAENGQRVNLKQISNTINVIRKQLL